MRESQIQAKIIAYLKTLPQCWFVKTVSNNMRGVPDILICYQGRFIAVEVKNEKGKASKLQLLQMESIEKSGGIAFIAHSFEEFKEEFLKCIGK